MQTTAHEAARVPPHARRYDITGCHLAAIVLERLQYWTPRTRVQKRGKAWIVKSRADLIQETRLTEKQLRAALEKLKERDIIQIEQLPFAGKNVTHIRFTPRGLMALGNGGFRLKIEDGDEPQVAQEGQPEMALEGQPEMAPQGQLLSQGVIDKGLYTGGDCNSYGVAANFRFLKKISGETKTTQETPKPTIKLQISEVEKPKAKILAEVIATHKVAKKPDPKPGKPIPLGTVWQEGMAEFYPGEFHPSLTHKAQGQLKQLVAKLPPGDAPKVIRAVLSDWGRFTDKAATEAKVFNVPLKPLPGFLLRYVAVAANFKAKSMTKDIATEEPGVVAPTGGWAKKSTQSITPAPVKPSPKELSKEEKAAFLASLD